ncbi:MAG: SDR family oxidoreductase [Pseudobdellovibrionaceae bacterium]
MKNQMPIATFELSDFQISVSRQFEEVITLQMIQDFSKFSGDYNPLHNDSDFAKDLGYSSVVAHGGIQQALISRLVGMYIPGTYSVIKKVETVYLKPIFVDQKVLVTGTLKQWSGKNLDGDLEILISDPVSKANFSINRIRFGLTSKLEKAIPNTIGARQEKKTNHQEVKNILLIGGSGGIGQKIKTLFIESGKYNVFISGRSSSLVDLTFDPATSDDECLIEFCEKNSIYAIINLASKIPLKQSPSNIDIEDLCENIKIHLRPVKIIAKAIESNQLHSLKRIVSLGSAWDRNAFFEFGYESYGYVKAMTKFYLKDISRQLAKFSNLTFNIVSPSELAVGMNSNVSERSQQIIGAKNPSGKMVSVNDVFSVLIMLFDENSSMIQGQEIIISGGRVK